MLPQEASIACLSLSWVKLRVRDVFRWPLTLLCKVSPSTFQLTVTYTDEFCLNQLFHEGLWNTGFLFILFPSLINCNSLMKKKCPSSRLFGYPEAWFMWERQDKCLLSPLSLPVLKVNWCVHNTLPWLVNRIVTTQGTHTEAESAGLGSGHGDVWEQIWREKYRQPD